MTSEEMRKMIEDMHERERERYGEPTMLVNPQQYSQLSAIVAEREALERERLMRAEAEAARGTLERDMHRVQMQAARDQALYGQAGVQVQTDSIGGISLETVSPWSASSDSITIDTSGSDQLRGARSEWVYFDESPSQVSYSYDDNTLWRTGTISKNSEFTSNYLDVTIPKIKSVRPEEV